MYQLLYYTSWRLMFKDEKDCSYIMCFLSYKCFISASDLQKNALNVFCVCVHCVQTVYPSEAHNC